MHAAIRGGMTSAPLIRAGSLSSRTNNPHIQQTAQSPMTEQIKLTIAKFTDRYVRDFPVKFAVCKGYYGPTEDLKFSEGDRFRAHAVKKSTVVNIEYDNGIRENIPVTSTTPFAVLFDPHGSVNCNDALKGYKFEKVSELIQLPILPPLLWSRKSYHGSSADSSVSSNELLIVRRVKARLVGRQQLKVYSHTHKKEKTLYTTCVGSFSTKPRDVALFLSDILKYMPDIFPCRAVMLNPEGGAAQSGQVVTLMHSSIETSLVISSTLKHTSQAKKLEIPIDLGIMVRLDECDAVYESTELYSPHASSPHASSQPAQPNDNNGSEQQFYTNVHFGQERSLETARPAPPLFSSSEAALEDGHYQSPREIRVPSDPIPIESMYHPPDTPANYVHLTKHRGEGSPGSAEATHSSGSPVYYRPPLPPPNRIKKDHQRSPGYTYVDTNPTRSTRVYNETNPVRGQAAESGENGSGLSTSVPDSASSEKSFGSSGSGGATVDRRSSVGGRNTHGHTLGSGDGIVERSMRTSSISSNGYSYAKTNPPHPHHLPPANPNLPTSPPHQYSHLRSRSGPQVYPQLAMQSTQAQQQQQKQQQRPVATTRLDENSDSLIVVQRQKSAPSNGHVTPGYSHVTPSSDRHVLHRLESAPVINTSGNAVPLDSIDEPAAEPTTIESRSRPDSLSGVLDNLTKMTQELDELDCIFPDDSPTCDAASTGTTPTKPSAEEKTDVDTVSPEIIAKQKAYLKSMDNYEVLSLLEVMGLEQYTPTFKQEQINGDILSTCDDALLLDELKVTSRLHRMRLLRVIEGTYSVLDIMSGKDGYIMMHPAKNS